MADTEAGLKFTIDAAGANKSLKELKAEVKALTNELAATQQGTKAYNDLAKQVAKAKNEIKDLHEDVASFGKSGAFNEIAGTGQAIAGGFAAATGAMALFNVESEDMQKQMLKVQASIAIVEGIKSATQGWESVQRLLNLAMAANPIAIMITAVAALTAVVVTFTSRSKDSTEELTRNSEAFRNASKEVDNYNQSIKETQREIDLATGKIDEFDKTRLEKGDEFQRQFVAMRSRQIKELKAVEDALNKELYMEQPRHQAALKEKQSVELNKIVAKQKEEEAKLIESYTKKQLLVNIKNIEADKKESEKKNKEASDEHKKQLDQQAKWDEEIAEQRRANDLKAGEERTAHKMAEQEQGEKNRLAEIEKEKKQLEAQDKWDEEISATRRENDLIAAKKHAEDKIAIEKALMSSLNSLAIIFSNDNKKLQEIQKRLAVIQLAIDTAKGISGAVAQAQSIPFPGNIAAIATGVSLVLANIAKAKQILSQAGASTGGIPTSGASVGGGAPTVTNPTVSTAALATNQQGQFTGISQSAPVKAYVVESEFNSVQKKVASITKKALFE